MIQTCCVPNTFPVCPLILSRQTYMHFVKLELVLHKLQANIELMLQAHNIVVLVVKTKYIGPVPTLESTQLWLGL